MTNSYSGHRLYLIWLLTIVSIVIIIINTWRSWTFVLILRLGWRRLIWTLYWTLNLNFVLLQHMDWFTVYTVCYHFNFNFIYLGYILLFFISWFYYIFMTSSLWFLLHFILFWFCDLFSISGIYWFFWRLFISNKVFNIMIL